MRGKRETLSLSSPGANPSFPGARHHGPSPAAPSLGRLFEAPRPHACGTGGRLMGQVLVPRAGSCPDKVGAEIALGQYSAVATWSCGWSHLRGSREERARGSFPPPQPSCVVGQRQLLYLTTAPCSVLLESPHSRLHPWASPSHLFPLPTPTHQLSPHSPAPGAKPRFQPPPPLIIPEGSQHSHLSPFLQTPAVIYVHVPLAFPSALLCPRCIP